MQEDTYSLEELIKILEDIRNKGSGDLNFCKALYCLSKEIDKLHRYLKISLE